MLNRIATLVMIVAVVLMAVPVAAQGDFDGYWLLEDFGFVFEIEDDQFRALEITDDECVEVMNQPIDGDILHEAPLVNADLRLSREGDELVVWLEEWEMARGVWVEALPDICAQQSQMSALLPESLRFDDMDEFDEQVELARAAVEVPGLAMAIVTPDGVVYSAGYGLADIEREAPVTSETPFLVSSVTKMVTATAVLHAWQQGAFDLDADINDLLPFTVDNPHLADETITMRHLLTHTSSIVDSYHYVNGYGDGDSSIDMETFLRGYLVPGGDWYDPDANFATTAPGAGWQYGNVATTLAAFIVQETTGVPFDEYCATHIFEPLGMNDTHWFLADYDGTIVATPYNNDHSPMAHLGHPTWPAGQLRSSVDDMGLFLHAVMHGLVLEDATLEEMLRPHMSVEGMSQALLWTHDQTLGDVVGHGGGDPGATVAMFYDRETDIGVVIFANEGTVKAIDLVSLLMETVFGQAEALKLMAVG